MTPIVPSQAKNRESSLSAYENGSLGRGGKFGSGGCGGGWSHISEALANLHEAIVRSRVPGSTQGGTPELNMRDAEVAQSVGFWLEQSGLLNRYGHLLHMYFSKLRASLPRTKRSDGV